MHNIEYCWKQATELVVLRDTNVNQIWVLTSGDLQNDREDKAYLKNKNK